MEESKANGSTTEYGVTGRAKWKLSNSNARTKFYPVPSVKTSSMITRPRKYYGRSFIILTTLFQLTEAYEIDKTDLQILGALVFGMVIVVIISLVLLFYECYTTFCRKPQAPQLTQSNTNFYIFNQGPQHITSEIPETPPLPNYDDLTPLNKGPWRFSLKKQQSILETSFTPPPKYENLNHSEVEALLFSSSRHNEIRLAANLTNVIPNTISATDSHPNAASFSRTNHSTDLSNQSQENGNVPLQTTQTYVVEVYTQQIENSYRH